ncbi:MAG: hypothetical protein NBV77_04700 [Bacteroidia bacterium]|nr:hypothetical protein [Bacteroidia bacterium]
MKNLEKTNWQKVARQHETFIIQIKTYSLHEVLSLWLTHNTSSIDVFELTDQICEFVDEVAPSHVEEGCSEIKFLKAVW